MYKYIIYSVHEVYTNIEWEERREINPFSEIIGILNTSLTTLNFKLSQNAK